MRVVRPYGTSERAVARLTAAPDGPNGPRRPLPAARSVPAPDGSGTVAGGAVRPIPRGPLDDGGQGSRLLGLAEQQREYQQAGRGG
jgi:hypothetical protein